jgi:hypothetical protein
MEVQGKLLVIGETGFFGTNGFAKREVVVETAEQYPQKLMIEFVQDKCNLVDAFAVGQNVKIGINLRGREWINPQGEPKYFNTLSGWKIEAVAGSAAPAPRPAANKPAAAVPAPTAFEPATDLNEEDYDDLPF